MAKKYKKHRFVEGAYLNGNIRECKICREGMNHEIHRGDLEDGELLNPWKIEVMNIYDTALDLRIINENTGEIKLLEGLTVDRINKLIEED